MFQTILALGWRNLWRQKRRTLLTLCAISIGLGSLIFFDAVVLGVRVRLLNSATGGMTGHGQIHHENWRSTGDPELVLPNGPAILEAAPKLRGITHATARLYTPVLAAVGDRSSSLTLCGIDPITEPQITHWRERLWQGRWPQKINEVLVGKKLAEVMELEVDTKLVLTAADQQSGELNSSLVTVCGIVASENPALNRYMVVSLMAKAQELSGLTNNFHEIVVKLEGDLRDRPALEHLLKPLAAPNLEVIPWQALMPGMVKGMQLQNAFMMVAFGVIFLLAGLGIANTMGMSLLERVREFGVLRAIGTEPHQLATMVVFEYLTLGLLGALSGAMLGVVLTLIVRHTGIPISNLEVVGMILNDSLFPVLSWPLIWQRTLVFIPGVPLLAIWPIIRIIRRDPARALHFE